ncbi:peptidoglycan bridge formation glycyltransferase FemA/FemB family protein [Candidatus Beckwithbacteria bacterium]|nr:peptidoglycan bridge formation glycyltransferase FemA/FemB family protein [Candidatus Beckwithbacteria bacterium]
MFSNTNLIDVRQTSQFNQFMQTLGWQQGVLRQDKDTVFYSYRTIPLTPFGLVKILRAKKSLDPKMVKQIKRKHRVVIFKQEPFIIAKQKKDQIYFTKDKNNSWPVLPTKTLWLDVTKSENYLLANLKAKTRYNLRKAQQKLVVSIISGDKTSKEQLQNFYQLWSKNKPHNWLFKPKFSELENLVRSFGGKCFFVFISQKCHSERSEESITNNLLATCLILTTPNMAFYWHNASTLKSHQLFAPTLCIWQAILESKKRKMKIFDFEGLWDERFPKLNSGWKGFTKFKLGFSAS